MAGVHLIGKRAMNQVISHLPGVIDAVRDEAQTIEGKAQAFRMQHWDQGEARITLSHGDVDSFVNLEDKAALPIEWNLHILRRAAGLHT